MYYLGINIVYINLPWSCVGLEVAGSFMLDSDPTNMPACFWVGLLSPVPIIGEKVDESMAEGSWSTQADESTEKTWSSFFSSDAS